MTGFELQNFGVEIKTALPTESQPLPIRSYRVYLKQKKQK